MQLTKASALNRDYQRQPEKYHGENPRIISDIGPQFIAQDLSICGMTHVGNVSSRRRIHLLQPRVVRRFKSSI